MKIAVVGTGYGGSCFPKDVQALQRFSKDSGYDFKILDVVMSVNQEQKTKLIPQMIKHFNGDLSGKTIAIWGLALKPYTDDIREAPALENIKILTELGATIKTYDPEAMDNVRSLLGDGINYADDEYQAAEDADALMIMTEWPVFRTPDFDNLGSKMKNKVIFDGRNLFDLTEMKENGFTYISIGRAKVNG